MRRFLACTLVALLSGLTLLVAPPIPVTAEARSVGPLRIGLVQTLFHNTPEAVVQIAMKPFKCFLESETGRTGEVILVSDAFALAHKLKDNQVQLAVLHGVEFAWARQRVPTLKPLIIAVNRYPTLQAELVVRQESKVSSPAGLEGKVVALARHNKEHCRLYFERRCLKPGATPETFCRKVRTPSSPESALQEVYERRADAAVVDRVALESFREEYPNRGKQLKVLGESEAFPCGVVAYDAGQLDEATTRQFRTCLLGAKDCSLGQKVLQTIRLTGFEAVPDNFESQLDAIARAYPATGTH